MTDFWAAKIYSSDGQLAAKTLLNTTTRVHALRVAKKLNQADKITLIADLTDPQTAGFTKTTYVEISGGTPSQSLQYSSYVQTLDRSVKRQGDFALTLASGAIALSWVRCGGALYQPHVLYLNVTDSLNGINAPGVGAVPGQKGGLTGSGVVTSWQDYASTPLATKTASGNVAQLAASVGLVAGGYTLTNGANQYNAMSLTDATGTDFYECTSVNSTTNVSIHPVAQRAYTTPTVKFFNYQLPGTGDSWRSDYPDQMSFLTSQAGNYGFHWRDPGPPTLYATGGTIPIGQFGDDSGVTVYGGQQLLAYQQAHGYPELTAPNLGIAQAQGLHVVDGVGYSDDLSHVVNMAQAIGHGSAGKFLTLKTIFGAINFASTYQPKGAGTKVYYLGPSYTVKHSLGEQSGNSTTYQLWAAEEQDSVQSGQKNYVYGVMNKTSVDTYGVHEGKPLIDKTIVDANTLLNAALGYIDEFSNPIPTWVLPIRPAMDANGLPPKILPGQKITVKYTGRVYALKDDADTASATYGQRIPDPANTAYDYLTFPTSGSTFPYVSRAMSVIYDWTPHSFAMSVQTGRGHKKPKHYYQDIAKHLEKQQHHPPHPHPFTKRAWEDIQWYFGGGAYVDPVTKFLTLPAGAFAISDVPSDQFFDDHHGVSFNMNLQDAASYCDFIFAKPTDGTVTSLSAPSGNYGVFRIPGTSSGGVGQFFYVDTVGTAHAVGWWKKNDLYNSAGQIPTGTCRPAFKWHGGRYRANIIGYDTKEHVHVPYDVAGWGDRDNTRLTGAGAIGFHCVGGSSPILISGFAAHPMHYAHPPKGSGTKRSSHHPTNPGSGKHKSKSAGQGGAGGGGRNMYYTQ